MGLFSFKKKEQIDVPPVPQPFHFEDSVDTISPVSIPDMHSFSQQTSPSDFDDVPLPPGIRPIPHLPEYSTHIPNKIPELTDLPNPPTQDHMSIPTAPTIVPLAQGLRTNMAHIPTLEGAPVEPLAPAKTPLPEGPLYLQISNFKIALSGLEDSQELLLTADIMFQKMMQTKTAQDAIFEQLREQIEDMERKLLFVDKTLFEGAR